MVDARPQRSRSRRALVAAVVVASTSVIVAPRVSVAGPLFADGFESGNLSSWTSVSALSVQQAIVNSGSWAARATGSSTVSYASASLGSFPELYARARFLVIARSTNVWVFSLRNVNGGAIALVGMNPSGRLLLRNPALGKTYTSSTTVTTGVWHDLELHVLTGASGRLDVWYEGVPVAGLGRSENVGSAQIGRFQIGENASGRTYDLAIDDVSVSTDRGPVDGEPPSVPQGLSATTVDSSQVDLSWQPSDDDVGVTGYAAYRSTDGVTYEQAAVSSGPAVRVSGLAPDTLYWFTVDAVDGAGNRSAPSEPATARTDVVGPTPPSVVLVLSDDQPADTIGRMPILQTELVGKGVLFTNGVVSNPLCCPSRASIQRGQYSHTTGVFGNGSPNGGYGVFKAGGLHNATIATWLDARGYRTGFVGKYMNGAGSHERPPGWDYWRGATAGYYNYTVNEDGIVRSFGSAPSDYSTAVYTGYADSFIRSTPLDTQLFLMVSPYAPHSPYTPAPQYAQDGRCSDDTNATDPSFNEADVSDKPAYIRNKGMVSQSTGVDRRRAQCRMLLSVDDLVGSVLDALSDTGRLGNTFVVFMSDNGSADGEHRWSYKMVPYEGSLRVPFVVRYDPLTGSQPRIDDHLVANVDLAPTILDLLDISVTPGCPSPLYGGGPCSGRFDGTSFLAELDGSVTPPRPPLLIEHFDSSGSVLPYCGIRTATHKFVRYTTGEEEMYDLQADPAELTNMLGDGSVTTSDQALRDGFMGQLFGTGGMCAPPPPTYSLP